MVTAAVALRATACRACACVAPCGGARVRAAAAPARTVGTERRRGGGVWVRCFVFRVVARPGRDTARRRRRAPRSRRPSARGPAPGNGQSADGCNLCRSAVATRLGLEPVGRPRTARPPGSAVPGTSARDAHDRNMTGAAELPNLHRRTGGTRIEIISNSIRRVCDTRAPHERGNAPRTTRARRRRVFLQRRAVTSTGADRIERNKSTRRNTYIDLVGWHGY